MCLAIQELQYPSSGHFNLETARYNLLMIDYVFNDKRGVLCVDYNTICLF